MHIYATFLNVIYRITTT